MPQLLWHRTLLQIYCAASFLILIASFATLIAMTRPEPVTYPAGRTGS